MFSSGLSHTHSILSINSIRIFIRRIRVKLVSSYNEWHQSDASIFRECRLIMLYRNKKFSLMILMYHPYNNFQYYTYSLFFSEPVKIKNILRIF